MAVNPIEDAYDALWTLLEQKSDFLVLFPNGTIHQTRYTSTKDWASDPNLDELADADYPVCRIVVRAARPTTERASSVSGLAVQYVIEIATGSQYQSVAFAACWAVYRAMLNWRTYVRDVVTWNSDPCVYDVDSEGIDFGDIKPVANRGTKQWIPIWTTTVKFSFNTADLQAN